MSSVVDWLSSIAESIIQIPIKIVDGILKGLKEIFIPDVDDLKNSFNSAIDDITDIIGLPIDSVKDAFESVTELPVQDITGDYNINGLGTMKLTFFDSTYFKKGIDYFRPLIRGFVVLMLFFYMLREILTFMGQDPGIYAHAKETAQEHMKKKGGGKE